MPKIDLAKRRRIMQRSRKLGHCICDPRRACPCDVFTDQGLCPCAGERPDPADLAQVRLTELVHNAGCASKIAPADLEAVLSRLPAVEDPRVISGMAAADDAGIYRLDGGTCLVQTVDVFTPCVDDPHTFGRICAANCLSDIYAMGGQPLTALSILAFPSETLDGRIMYEMLRGAMETLSAAGVALIGGHSIKDEEIKLGFAVTGTIDPAQAVSHETAHVGDVLVLTKPLGTGVLCFARQIGRAVPASTAAAMAESMAALNRPAAEAVRQVGVSAGTDVTGFGLLGHLIRMARHSGVTAQLYADALPAFDGVLEALRDGVIPGAIERNREFVADDLSVADGVDEAMVNLGFDAQTSGGLLIAVPAERQAALLSALARRGVRAATVGRIVEKSNGKIRVTLAGQDASAAPDQAVTDELPDHAAEAAPLRPPAPCCAEASAAHVKAGVAADAQQAFEALMAAAGAAGAIDARTKELIHFALVVQARCGPCAAFHLDEARKMGITQAELDEAAWCAAAMGGAPVRMFYLEALKNARTGKGCC